MPLFLPFAPFLWWRERRVWKRLARVGRVIGWDEASRQANAGTGTFVVRRAFPAGFADLWFVGTALSTLDPAGEMPRWSAHPRLGRMSRDAKRRLESLAAAAFRVRVPLRADRQISKELELLPSIEFDHFSYVALTGKLANEPFLIPFEDPRLESLRFERERLLEEFDKQLENAEYECAAGLRERVQFIERVIRSKLNSQQFNSPETASAPPAAPIDSPNQ